MPDFGIIAFWGCFILLYIAIRTYYYSEKRSRISKSLESCEQVLTAIQTSFNVVDNVIGGAARSLKSHSLVAEIKPTLANLDVSFEIQAKQIQEYYGIRGGIVQISDPFKEEEDIESWVFSFYAIGPKWQVGRLNGFYDKISTNSNFLSRCSDLNIKYIALTPFREKSDFRWVYESLSRVYKVEGNQMNICYERNLPNMDYDRWSS